VRVLLCLTDLMILVCESVRRLILNRRCMLRSVDPARIWRLHGGAAWALPEAAAQLDAGRAARP
jgi:hypothetical protein